MVKDRRYKDFVVVKKTTAHAGIYCKGDQHHYEISTRANETHLADDFGAFGIPKDGEYQRIESGEFDILVRGMDNFDNALTELAYIKAKKKICIDIWDGSEFVPKKYGADAFFREQKSWHNPEHCYAGNIYDDDGKRIGDYTAVDSTVIEENFKIKWRD